MSGLPGPSTTDRSGRELLGLGALVLVLGVAFVTLLVEPTQASARPDVERIVLVERIAPAALGLPDDRPVVQVAPASAPALAPPILDGIRVRVARLGIDLPLLPGDTVRDSVLSATPNGAAFLLPSTPPPFSGGNSYIYAHARAGMFLPLWDIRIGDVVEVTALSSEARRYLVTEIHSRVAATDFRHTLPTVGERITLQTSTGPRDTDPRFVVVAVRGS